MAVNLCLSQHQVDSLYMALVNTRINSLGAAARDTVRTLIDALNSERTPPAPTPAPTPRETVTTTTTTTVVVTKAVR